MLSNSLTLISHEIENRSVIAISGAKKQSRKNEFFIIFL